MWLATVIEAAKQAGEQVRRISFKGRVQALRQWEPHLNQTKISHQEQRRLIQLLYESIADYVVPERPGRIEPRAVKRRPKPYQILIVPRHEMKVTLHRGRYHAKKAYFSGIRVWPQLPLEEAWPDNFFSKYSILLHVYLKEE